MQLNASILHATTAYLNSTTQLLDNTIPLGRQTFSSFELSVVVELVLNSDSDSQIKESVYLILYYPMTPLRNHISLS